MANEEGLKLFGFSITRAKKASDTKEKLPAIVVPTDVDGAGYIQGSGAGHFASFINQDGDQSKDNAQLIHKYRGVSMHPEVDMAIEEIVNESIVSSDETSSVELALTDIDCPDKIKDSINEEFDHIISMLKFNELGHDIFRSFYVDGRVVYHLLVNESNPKAGIQDIRNVDAAKIRKTKKVTYKKDEKTGVKIIDNIEEFYVYEEKPGNQTAGIKLSPDAITYVTSGLLDESKKKVVSYLHKALKPINQLRMMEDSLVIYRLARAPERRIFYIDVGNLPRGKADQYMKDIMAKYRNKLVYDADTGKMKDDRKHMSMLEDFWLPRREGGKGTEISTLPGGENLGQIDDILYFQKRLYRSLNVPIGRLENENTFSVGRSTEISREEVKFQKFIDRLRRRFSSVFLNILRKQLLLKGIITEQDWDKWKDDIYIDFIKDNHFSELKDMEILRERIGLMNEVTQYVGEYYSKDWVMKNVMQLNEDEIKEMQKQVKKEIEADEIDDPKDKDKDEEGQDSEPAPTPVTVVDAPKEEEPKKEHVAMPQDEKLTEEMTTFMRNLNNESK